MKMKKKNGKRVSGNPAVRGVVEDDGGHEDSFLFLSSPERMAIGQVMELPEDDILNKLLNHPKFERLDSSGRAKFIKAAALLGDDHDYDYLLELLEEGEHLSASEAVQFMVRDSPLVFPDDFQFETSEGIPELDNIDQLRNAAIVYTKLVEVCDMYGITEWTGVGNP